jgi:ubiquinone/menaquinone biosynthesis C-methylase UbiE
MDYLKFEHNRDTQILSTNMAKFLLENYIIKKAPNVKNILDLGTGFGNFVKASEQLGLNVIGIDLRPSVYLGPKGRYVVGDARNLPFRDSSFDLIHENMFLRDILDFQVNTTREIDNYYKKVVLELYRILRPNGYLVTSPHELFYSNFKKIGEENSFELYFYQKKI